MLDSAHQSSTDMALDALVQQPMPLQYAKHWYEEIDWEATGLLIGTLVAVGIALLVCVWWWKARGGAAQGARWWWPHAAKALTLFIGVAAVEEWARHNYIVMQLLAGACLAALLLGGLWLIAGSADRDAERRRRKRGHQG